MARRPQTYRVRFLGRTGALDEIEIVAPNPDAAIRAAEEVQRPPKPIGFRLIDREGREVSRRGQADCR
jgi:hypothetical protein